MSPREVSSDSQAAKTKAAADKKPGIRWEAAPLGREGIGVDIGFSRDGDASILCDGGPANAEESFEGANSKENTTSCNVNITVDPSGWSGPTSLLERCGGFVHGC